MWGTKTCSEPVLTYRPKALWQQTSVIFESYMAPATIIDIDSGNVRHQNNRPKAS